MINENNIHNNFIDATQSPEQISAIENDNWEQWKTRNGLINLFDPTYVHVVQEADAKQYLNGSLPTPLKEIVESFVPQHTSIKGVQQDVRGLPRKMKKKLSKMPIEQKIVSYSNALENVLKQVRNDIGNRTYNVDSVHFSETTYIKQETVDHKKQENKYRTDLWRNIKHAGIPDKAFFTAPINQLQELEEHFKSNTENILTLKNYVGDIMKSVIIPLYKTSANGSYQEKNDAYNKLVNLISVACFSNPAFRGNIHPQVIFDLVNNTDAISTSDFRGALAESYGKYLLEHMHEYVSNATFQCAPLAIDNTTRRLLDLYVKSDAVYNVRTPEGQDMIWSVDFKNRGNRKEAGEVYSSEDIDNEETKITPLYDREKFTHKIRRALKKEIPVKGILLYVGLPSSFQDMHFTQSMIQEDANHFYNQLLSASTNASSPIQ